MAKLFINKIKSGEINPATGAEWRIEDVPMLWRAEVERMLQGFYQEERYGYY